MLIVIQRVTQAHVTVEHIKIGGIQQGLMILCGFEPQDNQTTLQKMVDKCLHFRIFEDTEGKMNKSLKDIDGGLLLVPQFTLMAETQKGLRPSFSNAASPAVGQALFESLVAYAQEQHAQTHSGRFGANMQVSLCNDGPATFLMKF